jgi:hypothetical protein
MVNYYIQPFGNIGLFEPRLAALRRSILSLHNNPMIKTIAAMTGPITALTISNV